MPESVPDAQTKIDFAPSPMACARPTRYRAWARSPATGPSVRSTANCQGYPAGDRRHGRACSKNGGGQTDSVKHVPAVCEGACKRGSRAFRSAGGALGYVRCGLLQLRGRVDRGHGMKEQGWAADTAVRRGSAGGRRAPPSAKGLVRLAKTHTPGVLAKPGSRAGSHGSWRLRRFISPRSKGGETGKKRAPTGLPRGPKSKTTGPAGKRWLKGVAPMANGISLRFRIGDSGGLDQPEWGPTTPKQRPFELSIQKARKR